MNYQVMSQRDPQWISKTLGFSRLTIGNYGCVLTCLTMLLNRSFGLQLTPPQVNEKLKSVNAFTGALILWARVPLAFPQLKWVYRDYNYNNVRVAWYVYGRGIPVMVEVNGSKIGASKHWVLFIGNRQMIDPWPIGGAVRPTSYYPLTGDAVFDKK